MYGCQTQEQLFFDRERECVCVVARTDSTAQDAALSLCKSGVEADEPVPDYLASQCFVLYEQLISNTSF